MPNRGRAGLGAPSKKTPARMEAIIRRVSLGMTRTKAAAYAGVAHVTVLRWAQEDPVFAAKLEAAEAGVQRRLLERLDTITEHPLPNTWQAIAWKLERRWP